MKNVNESQRMMDCCIMIGVNSVMDDNTECPEGVRVH